MAHPDCTTTSERFCCPECASDVALYNTQGGELAYHCQNTRCQKVVMLEAMDALAIKPVQPEQPAPATVAPLATPAARKAAYHLGRGLELVRTTGAWLVPSGTRAGIIHRVGDDGTCSCEAGQKRQGCWHREAVFARQAA